MAFVAVGETGAFVKAAHKLGITPSVVSHHVARLEEELGVTLVNRTTRKLSLSDSGRQLFETAKRGLSGIESVLEEVSASSENVSGTLRVALPAFVPEPSLEAKVMAFILRYPNVRLVLDYSDDVKDLVGEGYDVSIRIGDPPSSSLVRRKVSSVTHLLVASSDCLLRFKSLEKPQDLTGVPCVCIGPKPTSITLRRGKITERVTPKVSNIRVQSIIAVKAAALAGVGFSSLPEGLISEELREGRLQRVLPDWQLPQLTIQALWSGTSNRRTLASRFVDFLVT